MTNDYTNISGQMLNPSLHLRAHYERLETTLTSMHEAVVVTDAAGGVTFHYLWRPNGKTPLLINGRAPPMRDSTGDVVGAVWVFRDAITDQQLAAQLQAVLGEQEILLMKVHHRIKNNFQTIASLLGMQANAIEDGRAVAALEDSQQRIQSMALVHQSLYQSQDLVRVDGGEYLGGLVTELCRAHAAEVRHLTLTVTVDEVALRTETAIPCGLILTELLANALKHAFLLGRPGAIKVTLRANPIGSCVLTVCDDGVGFPANLDFRESDSLGLQLVCLLTEQLGGSIELTRSHGTHWRVTFPVASPKTRGMGDGVGQ